MSQGAKRKVFPKSRTSSGRDSNILDYPSPAVKRLLDDLDFPLNYYDLSRDFRAALEVLADDLERIQWPYLKKSCPAPFPRKSAVSRTERLMQKLQIEKEYENNKERSLITKATADVLASLEKTNDIMLDSQTIWERIKYEVACMCSDLRQHGRNLDFLFKADVDRYIMSLVRMNTDKRLDVNSRINILDLFVERAMNWQTKEEMEQEWKSFEVDPYPHNKRLEIRYEVPIARPDPLMTIYPQAKITAKALFTVFLELHFLNKSINDIYKPDDATVRDIAVICHLLKEHAEDINLMFAESISDFYWTLRRFLSKWKEAFDDKLQQNIQEVLASQPKKPSRS